MRYLTYLLLGTFFGIVMTKSEAISWYRILEMFRFESFHMYGIIGTAVLTGALGVALAKRFDWKTIKGEEWNLKPKDYSIPRYLFGGSIFGLGWAMTGACPGPLFTLVGQGIWAIGVIILSATVGTWVYGLLRSRLPH
ncbi:transporter [Lewinellaceae bacterium SD302]|nr:transporter [Lewinellaceae bacterium SD302]